jgi:hypothetical protein
MSRSGNRAGQTVCGVLVGAGICASLCFHASGCSSSTNGNGATAAELANFEGDTPWVGTITSTITCAGQTSTGAGQVDLVFSPLGASGLTYTLSASEGGCVFDFTVSGDTATLSNGPVNCASSTDAGVVDFSYTSLTFTTTDGHNLSGTGAATASQDGVSCSDSAAIAATR